MRLPRMTMRRLMILMGMAAVTIMAPVGVQVKQSVQCLRDASRHAEDEQESLRKLEAASKAIEVSGRAPRVMATYPKVREWMEGRIDRLRQQVAYYSLRAAYHGHWRQTYRRAAWRPWEPRPEEPTPLPPLSSPTPAR
jgi:hypothetical protein